jgi:hypothetical protein
VAKGLNVQSLSGSDTSNSRPHPPLAWAPQMAGNLNSAASEADGTPPSFPVPKATKPGITKERKELVSGG